MSNGEKMPKLSLQLPVIFSGIHIIVSIPLFFMLDNIVLGNFHDGLYAFFYGLINFIPVIIFQSLRISLVVTNILVSLSALLLWAVVGLSIGFILDKLIEKRIVND